jgi:hypothetical protein
VTKRGQSAVVLDSAEPAEPSPRHVLEEHALDGLARAELQNLRQLRLDETHRAIVA